MMIHAALQALLALGEPSRLLMLVAGVLIGLVLGVIPGLGGVVGLTLLIPFTCKMDTDSSFALLLGMAAVTAVSDLIPAVLFGVPGNVGAAATTIDGHALARQGQAGRALGAGYASALLGGLKALSQPHTVNPRTITVDKNPSYPKAVAEMRKDAELWHRSRLREVKSLSNIVERITGVSNGGPVLGSGLAGSGRPDEHLRALKRWR
jgi:hypothetical protein